MPSMSWCGSLDEHPVLERRRLAFVGVHHEVAREQIGRQERPLLPGREVGAAPAAQARHLHLLLHVGRIALREHRAQHVVRAARERAVDRPRVVGTLVQPLGDDASLFGESHQTPAPAARGSGDPEIVRRALARPVLLHQGLRHLGRELLVELVVHLHRRRDRRTRRGTRPLRRSRRRRARSETRAARGSPDRRSRDTSRSCTPTRPTCRTAGA